MTREQAEQIARKHQLKRLTEAHAERVKPSEWVIDAIMEAAAIERADEREACAKVCDSVDNYANPMTAKDCADAIRARSA